MGQRMAGSGSHSRKGFPETGGECCQPQGQEEMMYLEAHGVKPSPWARHSTLASSKRASSLRAGASSAWVRVRGPLLMARARDEPSCFKNANTALIPVAQLVGRHLQSERLQV